MDEWIVRIIFMWWFIVVVVSWPLMAAWGARVWAQYARDHRWSLSSTGPIPDFRDFLRAVQYYFRAKRDASKI